MTASPSTVQLSGFRPSRSDGPSGASAKQPKNTAALRV